jgi:hypothetical protein
MLSDNSYFRGFGSTFANNSAFNGGAIYIGGKQVVVYLTNSWLLHNKVSVCSQHKSENEMEGENSDEDPCLFCLRSFLLLPSLLVSLSVYLSAGPGR